MNLPWEPAHGGANRQARLLAEALAARGHAVSAVVPVLGTPARLTPAQVNERLAAQGAEVRSDAGAELYRLRGVEVRALVDPGQVRAQLLAEIERRRPDRVIVCSEDPSQNLLEAAVRAAGSRVVYWVHTPSFLPFGPQSFFPGAARAKLIEQVGAIVAVSDYVARYLEEWGGLASSRIYLPAYGPGPFPSLGRIDNPYVAMVNPCAIKGIGVFRALARAMPEVAFAAVPSWGTTGADRAALAELANVTLLKPFDSADELYRQVRVLVVPSIWDEAFGMVAVEAMLRGVPVLVSDRGGLPEAALGAGVVLPVPPVERFRPDLDENLVPLPVAAEVRDVGPWRAALGRLLGDRSAYEHASATGRAAALRFVEGLAIEPFEALLAGGLRSPGKLKLKQADPVAETAVSAADKIATLSPAKRALLERRLRDKALGRAAADAGQRPIERVARSGAPLPASTAQRRLWLLDQLQPGRSVFNIPIVGRLSGPLDRDALARALTEIVRRHEVLRTTFKSVDGEPVQVVAPEGNSWAPSIVDLSSTPAAGREAEAERLAREEQQRPFDLLRGPLFRALLLCVGEREHTVVLTCHHIVADGRSVEILLGELIAIYGALRERRPSPLPDLPLQYADFAAWQRAQLTDARLEAQLAYWRAQLEGAPDALELPTDRPRPARPTYRGGGHSLTLGAALVDGLKAASQREGVTLFMTALAAFQLLLGRLAGTDDVAVGSPVQGRPRPELSELIGFFAYPVVLRTRMGGAQTFRALLERVREVVAGAHGNQDVPLEQLLDLLRPARGQRPRLFQILFGFMGSRRSISLSGGLTLKPSPGSEGQSEFDLSVSLEEMAGEIQVAIGYAADLFDADTIAEVAAAYQAVLEEVARDPGIALDRLALPPGLARKVATRREAKRRRRIEVTSTFTAEPIARPLAFLLEQLELDATISFAPYNQVLQQLLDPRSPLSTNVDGVNVALVRLGDAARFTSEQEPARAVERFVDELVAALRARRGTAPLVLALCPDGRPGPGGLVWSQLERQLAAAVADLPGVLVVEPEEPARRYEVREVYDAYGDDVGHVPYTPGYFAALAGCVARRLSAATRPPMKVIVLDCDQTLWGGICGEDGVDGVVIDEPRRALQAFVVAQQQRGALLCLCSKNHEDDVWAVFDRRPEMVLRREHVVASRIDWRPKSENLRALATELSLGLDSFVFVDDSARECAEVREACPEVVTLELPSRPEELMPFLERAWAFDRATAATEEDRRRTASYQQQAARARARTEASGLLDFLQRLELSVVIGALEPDRAARVAQLTQRTNQFNLAPLRLGEAQLRARVEAGAECLTVTVRDRFGDYGLVGVVLCAPDGAALRVETFLLSCRVLGRGVEHAVLRHLGGVAAVRGLGTVDLRFVATERNGPARDFLAATVSAYEEKAAGESWYRVPAAVAQAAMVSEGDAPEAEAGEADARAAAPAGDATASARRARLLERVVGWRRAEELVDAAERLRRAIARSGQAGGLAGAAGRVAPRTPMEDAIAGLFEAVLDVGDVGVTDDFFELGGHSLHATQIVARIRQVFGVELPLRDVFETRAVAGLAREVERALADREHGAAPPLEPVARGGLLPLSFSQQRIWFEDQIDPDSPAYNVFAAVRIGGPLRTHLLERAFRALVARHEGLRTIFEAAGGEPRQRILDHVEVEVPIVELGGLADAAQEAEVLRRASAEARRPFDLTRVPLVRLTLLRLAPARHVALLSMHHIVSDGWSLGLLVKELAEAYAALVEGRDLSLPPLTIQYADYAAWQRRWMQGDVLAAQLGYWRERLAGVPAQLPLPTDRPRPSTRSALGGNVPVRISASLTERLRTLGRAEGASLYMTLLAAYQTLLWRYSGETDVAVGSPVAGRVRGDLEGVIGAFINMLVLRTDLSGQPSFRELLGRVRSVALGAYANQDLPFDRIVDALNPERGRGSTPMFQVVFALQNMPVRRMDASGLEIEPLNVGTDTAKFDLSLFLQEDAGGGVFGTLEYSADLFTPATVARMVEHLERLLESVVDDPARPIDRLALLGQGERARVLVEWNRTEAEPPARHVGDEVATQAERTPQAIAVECGGEHVTYEALERRARQLAGHLRGLGVGPEVRVGICLPRSIDLVVGMLGIWKAGGTYVPLDPSYPVERLRAAMEDAAATVLLTSMELVRELGDLGARTVCLDAEQAEIERAPEERGVAVSGEGGAYVIFTSGSTGRPKGVLIPHRALANHMAWMQREHPLGADDRVLQKTAIGFDASVWEFWAPLQVGATLVMAAPEAHRAPGLLVEEVTRHGITVLQVVPTMLRALLEEPGFAACASLRRVFAGGEALTPEVVASFRGVSGAELVNLYGPTEVTIDSVTWRCAEDVAAGAVVPIGRPISNTRAYVLDGEQEPVPAGVPGELYLGGEGLARGYVGRPDQTAERFVPDPFAGPGARLYRTGDRVRHTTEGVLEYLGRVDQQVKVRGYRIELGEIEAVLEAHEAVREAAVVLTGKGAEQKLAAYVTWRAEAADPAALRSHLGERLPEYMVPPVVVGLSELPLLPSGKIDRRALARMEPTPTAAGPSDEPPASEVERTLAEIWQELLGIERVSLGDDFFELGGHSLTGTTMIARVEERLGAQVAVTELFDHSTLRAFAAAVAAQIAPSPARDAIPPVERLGPLPMSYAQERQWFLNRLAPDSSVYHVSVGLRLRGALVADELEASLGIMVDRHESLRTTFDMVEGRPIQRVSPARETKLRRVDLSAEEPTARAEAEIALAAEEGGRPFDLRRGPLCRGLLIRLGPQDHVLVLVMHHIISDGWSMGLFIEEVSAIYQARVEGRPPVLPPLGIQYADFAAWQRARMEEGELGRQLAYWREQLAGCPAELGLPTDRPRPSVQSFRGASEWFQLGDGLGARIEQLSREEGVTLFMFLLAAFQVLLGRYAGQDDVVVGTVVANRTRAELERIVGLFVNTLALRTSLAGDPTFREVLRRVRAVTLGAYEHQEVPFERVVEEINPERTLSRSPIFQVAFAVQNTPRRAVSYGDLELSPMESEAGVARFDLLVEVWTPPVQAGEAAAGPLQVRVEYSTDLFERTTIRRMIAHWHGLLEAVCADLDLRVQRAPLLGPEERRRLLVEWNATAADYPRGRGVHQLFMDQASSTPAAIALACGDRRLTYQELDQRSNQVAHHLRSLGVGPDVLVGVCVDRSIELIVGLLGILKAGGAYVPLDPSYPSERLAYMLTDTRARVLLTETRLAAALPPHDARPVLIDADWSQIATRPTSAVGGDVAPSQLAYVIYTSGSTGRPKGAMITHEGLTNYLAWAIGAYRVDEGQGAPVHSSIGFDLTVTGLFPPLLRGRAVTLLPEDAGVEGLERVLRSQGGFSLVKITPAHLDVLNLRIPPAEMAGRAGALVIGGEALSNETVAPWRAHAPATRLINEYGPTETVVGCCVYEVPAGASFKAVIPIGRPIANTTLFILDRWGSPTPIGVPGELYIGGVGVARGYLNRPDLTAERFLPDPFGEPGARVYRTGDLARYLPDGDIEYLGRIDHQVKVRGFRIELGEIEAALTEHADVREAVVMAREDTPGQKRLVAYVTSSAPASVSPSALRAHLEAKLPQYMVPTAFVTLPELPLTENGKVDRKALPDVDAVSERPYEPPATPTEQLLADVWQELLRVPRVGRNDGFFELGGHSLFGAQMIARVEDRLGTQISITDLFDHSTLRDFASVIDRSVAGTRQRLPPIERIPREPEMPVSFYEARLWRFQQAEPETNFLNLCTTQRVSGPLDLDVLRRAFDELVRRHEVLRTSFSWNGVELRRVIAPASAGLLQVEDVSAAPEAERVERARALLADKMLRPFDLAVGPLVRAVAVRISPRDHAVGLVVHHIISDGWSTQLTMGELFQLYGAFEGRNPMPAEPRIQYADFAVWQRSWLSGAIWDEQARYWQQRLDGAPRSLAFRRPKADGTTKNDGGERSDLFPPHVLAKVTQMARSSGCTVYMVLMASFCLQLREECDGQDDLVIGIPVALRHTTELEGVIGYFLNHLPVRVRLTAELTVRDLFARVREAMVGALAHRDLPLMSIFPRDPLERWLYQVRFNMLNMPPIVPDETSEPGAISLGPFEVGELAPALAELGIYLDEVPEGLSVRLKYNRACFTDERIHTMIVQLRKCLEVMAEDPSRSLDEVSRRVFEPA
jgi:amino acid adenylation domain-containing protein/FkbH-like protein